MVLNIKFLILFMPLVTCSYTSRNAQIINTQWDDNTEDRKYFIIDSVEELTEYIENENEIECQNMSKIILKFLVFILIFE